MDKKKALGLLAGAAIETAPGIIEHFTKKKEEKSFLENNKVWIYSIILSIFVINLGYIYIFSNNIINSIINIIYSVILFIFIFNYYKELKEEKELYNGFIKSVYYTLIILGVFNILYHFGYAIYNLSLVIH